MAAAPWESDPVVEASRKPAAAGLSRGAPWEADAPTPTVTSALPDVSGNAGGLPRRTGAAAVPTAGEVETGVYTPQGASPAALAAEQRRQRAAANPVRDKVVGAVEGALDIMAKVVGSTAGGLVGVTGLLGGGGGEPGMAAGAEKGVGLVRDIYRQTGLTTGQEPETEFGQTLTGGFDELASNLPPVIGVHGTLAGTASAPPRAAAAGPIKAITDVAARAAEAMQPPEAAVPAKSVGAKGVDVATQRRERAASLPVPIKLTRGEAERTFEKQRFEKETAKSPEIGKPLRERREETGENILKNFEEFVDQTGAADLEATAVGKSVTDPITAKAVKAKKEINEAYNAAEAAGETAERVPTDTLVRKLNEVQSSKGNAGVIGAAENELIRLGGAARGADGELIAGDLSLGEFNELRKLVGTNAGKDATNAHFAGELKAAIDVSTADRGGELYQQARKMYADYAGEFKNQGVIRDLIELKKNSSDRKTAMANVFDRSILNATAEDVRNVRRTLTTAGDGGVQAWNDLRGKTIDWIREQATASAVRSERGNRIISADKLDKAVKKLDKDGRLEILFGKQGAQQLRDVSDIAADVYTAPPGAVNTSNTASVILDTLATFALSGGSLPIPAMLTLKKAYQTFKERKLKAKVRYALGPDEPIKGSPTRAFEPEPPTPPDGGTTPPPTPPGNVPPAQAILPGVEVSRSTSRADASPSKGGREVTKRERELTSLREQASDPQVLKDLDTEIAAERRRVGDTKRAAEYRAIASATTDPELKAKFTERADKLAPDGRRPGESDKDFSKRVIDKRAPPANLPDRPSDYFTDTSRVVPLDRLVGLKSEPVAGANAAKRMSAASAGEIDKRPPITIEPSKTEPGKFDVIDGNGTLYAAREHGWKGVPTVERVPVGEAIELDVQDATLDMVKATAEAESAWRREHRLGDQEATRAKATAQALQYDAAAVERAAQQFENSPRAFDRDVQRIIDEGKARETQVQQGGVGGEGLGRRAEAGRGQARPRNEPAGPDGDAAAGTQRAESESTGRTPTAVERAETYLADRGDVPPAVREAIVGRYREAEAAHPVFADALKAIGDGLGSGLREVIVDKIKVPSRATEKILVDYKGDASKIRDLVRGMLVLRDIDSVPAALKALEAKFGKLVSPRNSLIAESKAPTVDGYRDMKANVMVNGHMAEIQINVPEMIAAKKEAHPLYGKATEIRRTADKAERDLTPQENAEVLDLEARQRAIYDSAWAAATNLRKAGSSTRVPLRASDSSGNLRGGSASQALTAPSGERVTGTPSTSKSSVPAGNDLGSDIAAPPASILNANPVGRQTIVTTERGVEIPVRYRVADVGQLVTSHDDALKVNPAFDQSLQPRDRSRAASEAQIAKIAGDIKPELLAESAKASDGSPIIGADGIVESGNARTIALRRAYQAGNAAHYREWLREHAGRFGLSRADVDRFERPVLVREGMGDYDRAEFAKQANESPIAAMSDTEQARGDAQRLPDLEGLNVGDDGQINPGGSAEFIRQFMRYVVSPADQAQMMTADGRLSQRGANRIRNAIFARAYNDPDIVAMMAESTDANVRNILAGMLRAAPEVAQLRTLMEAGARVGRDFVPDLVEAVRRFGDAREQGQKVEQALAQGSLIGGEASPQVGTMMRSLEADSRAPKRIAEMIRALVDAINTAGDPRQPSLL